MEVLPLLQLGSRQKVSIHPSSVLFHAKPACVVFTELVQTGKRYVRQVTLIDQDWIEDLPKDTLQQLRLVRLCLIPFTIFTNLRSTSFYYQD